MLLAGEVEDAALPAGAKLGRYVVLEQLGLGGMSIVYKAYDPQLDRAIALKLVRVDSSLAESPAAASGRLLREAQALAKVSHPNIVAVHDVGLMGDDVFVAMEFVAGLSLAQWCKQERRTMTEILEAFRGAGRGLAAAHATGLVHRDFKPDNVIVGSDGRPRVLDFGLARAAGAAEPPATDGAVAAPTDPRVTSAGATVGTPAYMAPEQHARGTIDGRTDQFSFCVALYEALYGQLPFAGDSVEEIVDAVTHGRIAPAPADARVPGWLRQALLRGLSVSPAHRYPSMDALLSALDRNPRARRRTVLAVAVCAVVVAVAVSAAWPRASARSPCEGARAQLAGVWDRGVKARVRAAFEGSGRPQARATFERVSRVLDGQAAEWTAMKREVCEARRDGRQDARATALRTVCLEHQRREVAELTAKLAKADGRVVDRAVHAAFELTSVAACADVAALALGQPAPENGAPAPDPDACGVPAAGRYYPLEVGRVWVYDVINKGTRRSRGDPKIVTVEPEAPIGGCKGERRALLMRQQTSEGYAFRWQEVIATDSPAGRPPGQVTVRHRDQWFSPDGTMTKDEYYVPSRIRLDESCPRTLVGASYLDAYDEVDVAPGRECGEEIARKTRTFDWRVVGVDVPLQMELDYSNPACCPPTQPDCGPPPDVASHTCSPLADRRWSCRFSTLQVDRREVSGRTAGTYWFAADVGKVLEDEKGEDREVLVCFR